MYRTLRSDEIVQTASKLRERIHHRFPDSGLRRVADELLQVAKETQERCRHIAKPNAPLRIAVSAFVALGIAGIVALVVRNVRLTDSFWDLGTSPRAPRRFSAISCSWARESPSSSRSRRA